MEIQNQDCSTLGINKERTEDKQKQTNSHRVSEIIETETNIIEFEFFDTDITDSEPLTENNNNEELDEEDVVDRIFQAANSGKEKDLSNLIFSSHYKNQDISDVGLKKRNNKISFPLKRKSAFHIEESEESSKKSCQKVLNFKNVKNKRPANQYINSINNNKGCYIPVNNISTGLSSFPVQPSASPVSLNLPRLVSPLSLQKPVSAPSDISSSLSSVAKVPVSTASEYNTLIDFSVLTKSLSEVLEKSIGLNENNDIKLVLFCNNQPVKSFTILKTQEVSVQSEIVNNLIIKDPTKSDDVNCKKQSETFSTNGYRPYHIEGNEIGTNSSQSSAAHGSNETIAVQDIKKENAEDGEYASALSNPKDKNDFIERQIEEKVKGCGLIFPVTKTEPVGDEDLLETVSTSEHFESTPCEKLQTEQVKPSIVTKDQKSAKRRRSRAGKSHKKATKDALVKPGKVYRIKDGQIEESFEGDATHLSWTPSTDSQSSVNSSSDELSKDLELPFKNSPEELTDINTKFEGNEGEESQGNLVIKEPEFIEDSGSADKKKEVECVSRRFICEFCDKLFGQKRYLGRHQLLVHGLGRGQSYKKTDLTDLQKLPKENVEEYSEKSIDEFLSDQLEEQKIKTGDIDITDIAVESVPHSDEDFINLLLKRKSEFHEYEPIPQYKVANLQNLARIEKLGKSYEIPPVFVCEHCGKFYRSRKSLKEHFQRVHLTEPGQEPLYIFIEKNSFTCTLCFKSFPDPYQLVAHSRGHVQDSPLKCVLCEKTYSSVYVLRRHIDTVHQDLRPRPYKCKLCSYAASNRWHLTEHERRHTGEQPFQCPVCMKNFSHQGTMNRHCKVIHNVIPGEPKRLFYLKGDSEALMPRVISAKTINTPSSTSQNPGPENPFKVKLSNSPIETKEGKVQLKPVPVAFTGPFQGETLIGNTGLGTEKDPAEGDRTNPELDNPMIVIKTEPVDDI